MFPFFPFNFEQKFRLFPFNQRPDMRRTTGGDTKKTGPAHIFHFFRRRKKYAFNEPEKITIHNDYGIIRKQTPKKFFKVIFRKIPNIFWKYKNFHFTISVKFLEQFSKKRTKKFQKLSEIKILLKISSKFQKIF